MRKFLQIFKNNMKKIIIKVGISLLALSPIIVFAEQKNLSTLVNLILKYFQSAIYLIIGLAVVMFVWNVFRYFIANGDEANKTEAGKYVMWSVIGFFVVLSFWGIVNILINTLELDNKVPSTGIFGTFNTSKTSDNSLPTSVRPPVSQTIISE